MLKIFIGPNGYGKTYELERIKKSLFDEDNDRKDIIMLGSELVFADEMKDTVNNSFLMDYIITELLVDDELINLQKQFENKLDTLIKDNSDMYNELMDETLDLNSHKRTKDVIAPQKTREYKKLVKINADDLKASMGSGQKLHFLLKLIEKSNKRYIFLDEPENHSHPSMLNITANLINKLSETKDVYIATHSPELLNMLNIDFNNSYIFNDPECKGPKTIDFKKAANALPSNINIENLYSNSKTYYDEEKLKNNILDIHKKEFMSALFSNKVYIVEGINDQLFLKKVLNSAGKQFEQYSIFPCYGKPHYFPFIEIFKDLGIDVVLLFDEDKTSDETNNKINTELQKNKHYMFSEILEKEIGYNGDKGNLSKFLDYLTSYNGYEKYFSIVED
jgi:predicted ATP-dependent endonuclease of OLD family